MRPPRCRLVASSSLYITDLDESSAQKLCEDTEELVG